MLAFIIPLRSSSSTNNWSHVCKLYERTLRSICQQTDNRFVVVVCNEIPEISYSHSNIEFVKVDFAVNSSEAKTERELKDLRELDKARRMWTGLDFLQSSQKLALKDVSHVMFVDADDCITMKLAAYVNHRKSSDGWYVNTGYKYPDGKNIVYPVKKDLCYQTNTGHIIKLSALDPLIPEKLKDVTSAFLFHHHVRQLMSEIAKSLEPLPFPAVAYITDNGENMYMQKSKLFAYRHDAMQLIRIIGGTILRSLRKKPLSQSIRKEFGIYQLNSNGSPEPLLQK